MERLITIFYIILSYIVIISLSFFIITSGLTFELFFNFIPEIILVLLIILVIGKFFIVDFTNNKQLG